MATYHTGAPNRRGVWCDAAFLGVMDTAKIATEVVDALNLGRSTFLGRTVRNVIHQGGATVTLDTGHRVQFVVLAVDAEE